MVVVIGKLQINRWRVSHIKSNEGIFDGVFEKQKTRVCAGRKKERERKKNSFWRLSVAP